MANSTGNENITIQEVGEDSMTLNVNGEIQTIHKQLADLKEILKSKNVSNITYENKVYNIEHINEANFGVVTSSKVFNGVLTKELILLLKDKAKPAAFLNKLPPDDKDNWEGQRQHLNEAQGVLADTFIWVVGWELRRLFSIGNEKEKSMEFKVDQYINHCFSTYRISLQLINYLFISKLWDEKSKNPKINTDKEALKNFFAANRMLKLGELRSLFQALIDIFRDNKLPYPVDEADLGDINEFLKDDSPFNKACADLESIEAIDIGTEAYGLGHCHTAEISLTAILKSFKLLTNYQLVTLRKIEYEETRNSAAMYIKDLNILEKREAKNLMRILKYDDAPALTYSVFFRNEKKAVNLFPFLLDYNALANEADFQLYFYQYWDGESGLHYFSIKSEEEEVINYMATEKKSIEIEDEDQKNKFQTNIRLDMVTKQFEEAMNTILGSSNSIKPKASEISADNLSNL